MLDCFSSLSTSDKIQILSIVCTSFLSIVAIIISVITLIQNNKMIFEGNKPNISIFSKIISFNSPHIFLVLKNFGSSGGIILNIEYDEVLNTYFDKKPFENMKNVFIAPNQSFVYPLDYNENIDKTISFKITYKYLNKIYTENHIVNFSLYHDLACVKFHSSKDLSEISEILQEGLIQDI